MTTKAMDDAASHRTTFFRQSGWMMIATVASGVFAFLVHLVSKVIPEEEYRAFGALVQLFNWMIIPGLGLQLVFAHQASSVVTESQRRQLVGTFKAVMRWTFYVWCAMVVVVFLYRHQLVATLKLSNPVALWVTVFSALAMIWLPLFNGLLQGRHNFMWMGWVAILNGGGRVAVTALIVLLFHGWATGAMTGILIGMVAALAVALWQNADLLREQGAPFDKSAWLKHVIPLTLGCGAGQFMFSADAIVVQAAHLGNDAETAAYMFGGVLARAIVLFTAPLAAVMFSKLVHVKARSGSGGANLFALAMLGTVALACVGAIGLWLTSPLIIRFGARPEFLSIVPLIPLFAWAMVPMAIGNVLLNNLMAHSRFKVVPALVLLAAGYWIALQHYHDSFKMVIQTFGIFNLLFLAICALFTWPPWGRGAQKMANEGLAR